MKTILSLAICLLASQAILAQVADGYTDAAALVAQRDAEEKYKRLSALIQNLQDNQEVLLKRQEDFRQRLDKLADDIRSLKDDQNRSSGKFVTRDELRSYVEKLKEIDEKREADKKLILENIEDLAKLSVAPPPEPRPSKRRASESSDEPPYEYVVKKNDRLLDIIAEYNNHFQKQGQSKITVEQVLKANPGLKPDLLVTGKKLHIPAPSKEAD